MGASTRFEQVYILHFSEPYKHAQHYVGYSANVTQRLYQHRHGRGVGLTRAVIDAGITISLARVFPGGKWLERLVRSQKQTRKLCPFCNENADRCGVNLGAKRRRENSRIDVGF